MSRGSDTPRRWRGASPLEATGDRSHLEVAHELLVHLRDHAPPEYRETMIVKVPLYRDIQAAWDVRRP